MNRYICLIFVFFLGVSCRDFLEEQSQDLAYVTSINGRKLLSGFGNGN